MTTVDRVAVLPFSADDDSAVTWAVNQFADDEFAELRVVHPNPRGIGFPELSELRARFASHLAGRFRVWVGHPDAAQAREAHPTLHFARPV